MQQQGKFGWLCKKRSGSAVRDEKRKEFVGEAGIFCAQRGNQRSPLFGGQGDRFGEELFEAIFRHAQAARVLLRNR